MVPRPMPGTAMLHRKLGRLCLLSTKSTEDFNLLCDVEGSTQSTANKHFMVKKTKGSSEWEIFLGSGVSQEEASVSEGLPESVAEAG